MYVYVHCRKWVIHSNQGLQQTKDIKVVLYTVILSLCMTVLSLEILTLFFVQI